MIYSMTGFARHQHQGDWGQAVWELRSVNHRYLDVSIKVPDRFRALENDMREVIRTQLGRGKVEAYLKFQPGPAITSKIELNEPLLEQLGAASSAMAHFFPGGVQTECTRLLQWPGLIQESSDELEPAHQHILEALTAAVAKLKEARAREGEAIKTMLTSRLAKISEHIGQVQKHYPEILAAAKQNIVNKLSEVQEQLDQERLEQELVYFAQRIDIAEELDRLDAHVAEIHKVIEREENIGRRLDFFMQELNREANTLGSKSQSVHQTHASVDIKVLIEQMREQVQNIE